MKVFRRALTTLGIVGLAVATSAVASDAKFEPVAVTEMFVPIGYDDNDQIAVVLDGYLPNSCYKLSNVEIDVDVNASVVHVEQMARVFEGPCIMALVPFTTTVTIGVLPEGEYKVSINGGDVTEKLAVNEASSAGPDEHLYAPIETVYIEREPNGDRLFAVVKGRFTNSCMTLPKDGVVLEDHGKTINLLPIMPGFEQSENCRPALTTFTRVVPLPEKIHGRYLLHARSLNGQSVNTVFAIPHSGMPW